MKCQKCGMYLPDDSEFCQYCGEKVLEQKAQSGLICSNDEYIEQAESLFKESPSDDSRTSHDENIGMTGGGRYLVDGPDGMPVWISADQLGKKQTVNEAEVNELKESLKSRLIPDYQSQDHTEKTAPDYENDSCPSCGQKLPKGSEFCPYCGVSLTSQTDQIESVLSPHFRTEQVTGSKSTITPENREPTRTAINPPRNHDSKGSEALSHTMTNKGTHKAPTYKHCKKCGGIIDPKSRLCTDCRKQYFVPRYGVPIIVLAVLLAACLGLSALVFYHLRESQYEVDRLSGLIDLKNSDVADLRTKNKKQQETISSQDSTIDELYERIKNLETENTSLHASNVIYSVESKWFNDICDYLNSGNIGYAASNFCVDESVVLIHRDDGLHKTKLTAYWNNGGTVSFIPIGSCATIDFEDETWRTSTNLLITPSNNGVMEVIFYNDIDDNDFKMIIIVVD